MPSAEHDPAVRMATITDDLVSRLHAMNFSDPVSHVYNPLIYARIGYDQYVYRYGNTRKRVLFVGMNPGPFGMAQTGVPFGDVEMVKQWMGIDETVGQPDTIHPKRPVDGFACRRREVSGRRLWEWARQRFGPADAFFSHCLVLNYCPLVFMEVSGRNRTPNRLPAVERRALFQICDRALRRTVANYQPEWVVGVGGFAAQRSAEALAGINVPVGRILHPSPANPRANRGWSVAVEQELAALGIALPPG